jgi:general transcription factor IIIA
MRTEHPPSCMHPSCNGRVFACQKNLREHQKLHDLRDLEEQINTAVMSETEDLDGPPLKKRRGGELGRDWKCTMDGCEKDFKSVRHLLYFTVHGG